MAPTYGSRQSQNVGEHLPQHLINTDGTSEDQWGNVRIVHIPVVPPRGFRALYSGGIVLRSPGDQLEEWHCYLEPRQGGARLSQCYLTSAAKALYQL